MTKAIILVAALLAVIGLIAYAIYRANRDPILKTVRWSAPRPGSRWEHCGRLLTVVDNGWIDEEWAWRDGVACDYLNEDGHLERVLFTPAQWEAVLANNPKQAAATAQPYARVPHDCDGYGRDE